MKFAELDQLKASSEKKIREIEKRYFENKASIPTYREEIQKSKKDWETKERFKDNSLSYPSYGRGLQPNIQMNTYMIQENMTGMNKKKAGGDQNSPKASVAAL